MIADKRGSNNVSQYDEGGSRPKSATCLINRAENEGTEIQKRFLKNGITSQSLNLGVAKSAKKAKDKTDKHRVGTMTLRNCPALNRI